MWQRIRKIIRLISFTTLLLLGAAAAIGYFMPDAPEEAQKLRLHPLYAELAALDKGPSHAGMKNRAQDALSGGDDAARAAALRFLEDEGYKHPDDAGLDQEVFVLLGDYYLNNAAGAKDPVSFYRNALRAFITRNVLQETDRLRCKALPPGEAAAPPDLSAAYVAIDDLTFDALVNAAISFELVHGARQSPGCGGAYIDGGEWDLRRMVLRERLREKWKARLQAAKTGGNGTPAVSP